MSMEQELQEAFARLNANLSSAPADAEKCFVSLDDHRTILTAWEVCTNSQDALIAELAEALEATLDGLRRASRELSDTHRLILDGKPWGGLLIANAEAVIARATLVAAGVQP